jgi:hypothetical protein
MFWHLRRQLSTQATRALSISACRKAMMFASGRMAKKAGGKSALVSKMTSLYNSTKGEK